MGKQIVVFVNRYQLEQITLIPPIGFKLKYDNTNMPLEFVKQIHQWLIRQLTSLKNKP